MVTSLGRLFGGAMWIRTVIGGSDSLAVLFLGVWAAAVAVAPGLPFRSVLAAIPLIAALIYWVLLSPNNWMRAFFAALLLLPPLPFALGDAGIHPAPLLAGLGVLSAIVWLPEWRWCTHPFRHPFSRAYVVFVFVLFMSVGLAAFYSGWQIGLGSLIRVILFCLSGFVFFFALAGPQEDFSRTKIQLFAPKRTEWNALRRFSRGENPAIQMTRLLYWLAVIGAAFACLDFYFQFPVPAGYGDQYIYLQEGVLRRAQGLFYESSTLGNFCAFFLVMIAVAFTRTAGPRVCSKALLLCGGAILSASLMFSYSRASVLNVTVALCALFLLRARRFRRSFAVAAGMFTCALSLVFVMDWAFPALSTNYWGRLLGSFSFFSESPDKILSGRLGHWQVLADFLAREPWHLLFGVGYKTLPYSTFAGSKVIADNTYLGLLVETGVVGLAAFLYMNVALLKTSWRALRSTEPTAAFLGQWMFCFGCGQVVQMFFGDLITYWRVWPVYLWVLGSAARATMLETAQKTAQETTQETTEGA